VVARRIAWLVAVAAALAAALAARPGAAAPAPTAPAVREVAAVTLPSRAPGAAALATRVQRVGARLAGIRGMDLSVPGRSETEVADVATTLARAQELAAAGSIDEAARLLDGALEAGARAPHLYANSDALVSAHVTRASIALARGEDALAAALLGRLLRWDPAFALADGEDTPRLSAALAATRKQLGETPALRPEDLGGLCAVDELLVARPLGGGRVEVQRLARCKPLASAVVRDVDENVLPLLGVPLPPPRRAERRSRPVHERAWFWVAAGAVVGAAAIIVWQASDGGEAADVVPHF
jgi:hypothetical protein